MQEGNIASAQGARMTNRVYIVGNVCVFVSLPVQYPALRLTNMRAPALKYPPILFLSSHNTYTLRTHTLHYRGNRDFAATCAVRKKKKKKQKEKKSIALSTSRIPKPPTG